MMKRKLQVGDFVKDGYPNRSRHVPDRYGFIIEALPIPGASDNWRECKVLWSNGEIGNNIYHYDLELVK